jgi:hypothetical protein
MPRSRPGPIEPRRLREIARVLKVPLPDDLDAEAVRGVTAIGVFTCRYRTAKRSAALCKSINCAASHGISADLVLLVKELSTMLRKSWGVD